jgi:hypothetical protein
MSRCKSLVLGLCLCLVVSAVADEEAEDADELSVSGFIETSMTANLMNPPVPVDKGGNILPTNQYVPYFTQPLSFHIGTVHIAASGSKAAASYTLEVDAGTVAKGNSGGSLFDIQEAYINYDFGNVKVTAGKFATFEGIDLVETPLNPVITPGVLYWLAEPIFHVGTYATVPVGEKFEVRAGIVNGWDELHDDAANKSVIFRLGGNYGYLTWGLSGTYGKEYGGAEPRLSVDLTGVLTASDKLTLNYQGNYGQEKVGDATMKWTGAGLQPVFALSDRVSLSARGEFFKDDGGFRSGTTQTLISATGCAAYALTETTKARCELRFDTSDQDVFYDANGDPASSQITATVQLAQMF